MKKKKTLSKAVGVGLSAAAVSAMLTGCTWLPWLNRPVSVYGPPEEMDPNYDPDQEIAETVYGPPEWFEPGDNEPIDVYGPPPGDDDYDPGEEIPAPVYGPPEWYGPEPVTPAPGENP